ncbi:MAG: PadR family transcriptional regulator [bacterium]
MRTLKYTILGLLYAKPQSGADISRSFEGILGQFWSAKHSQIYPELKKLTKEKLIVPSAEDEKLYELTPAGEEALLNWLCLDEAAEHTTKDVFCIRMLFSDHLDHKRVTHLIHSQLMQHRANLHFLRQSLKEYDASNIAKEDLGSYLLIKRAIGKEKSYISWLTQCLPYFKEP